MPLPTFCVTQETEAGRLIFTDCTYFPLCLFLTFNFMCLFREVFKNLSYLNDENGAQLKPAVNKFLTLKKPPPVAPIFGLRV